MSQSILARAQRIVELGKAATPGPWFPDYTTHGDPFVCLDSARSRFTQICKTDTAPVDYGRGNNAFIAAARDADQIAAKLIEAEAVMRRIVSHAGMCSDYRATEEMKAEARAFLATLRQETP